MSDTREEVTVGTDQCPPQLSKRKPDAESIADETAAMGAKKQKPEALPADSSPAKEVANGGEKEEVDDGVGHNGNSCVDKGKGVMMAADKGKGVMTAADKGKGKMVVEDDDEEEDDSDDDDSDDDSGDILGGGEGEEDSDFEDDPLAEVDLDNILPSRTRRRAPPPPGAYLVNDPDGEEEDDDDDDGID